MKPHQFWSISLFPVLLLTLATSSIEGRAAQPFLSQPPNGSEWQQVPAWSQEDFGFFLHGSMSTEFVPESVLRAWIATYPDLFPKPDLSHFGLIPDEAFGWPVGFSRSHVRHLGGLSSVGVNCAACHVGEVTSATGAERARVLGMTSHFDAEAFFGAVLGAAFRTSDPANMKRFLAAYLAAGDPDAGKIGQDLFATEWQRQEPKIVKAIEADPFGSKQIGAGALYPIESEDVRFNADDLKQSPDLPHLATSMLRLFHNMRAALHVPDQPPEKVPPASGPGRNDAFGLLSFVLFGAPQPYAPVKYGLVWNMDHRRWVHWDANTQSPIGRNLLASLGLGAPLLGNHGHLDFTLVKRQTDLSESIRAPIYPFAIDRTGASRGFASYKARCALCHDGPESEARLHPTREIGTEPHRAELFTQLQADRFNKFLAELETAGYEPAKDPGIRSTQKYWAPTLSGVWARSPYLHNGSVRTLRELLTPFAQRGKSFRRGSRVYEQTQIGYADQGAYVLDTTSPGNSNAGHEYGTDLTDAQKGDLIEYLKTL